MGRIVVSMSLTLDGVMQAPGRSDEDTRGGFQHGGWAVPYFDSVMSEVAAAGIARSPAILLGRRTYEDFYSVWPRRTDSPYAAVLNDARKVVASNTLREPLPWMNSELIRGDVPAAVAALKQELRRDIVVLGSGALVQSLMQANLIDEFVLFLHPLVLGSGRRLFGDRGVPSALRLVGTRSTMTGVVIAVYRPIRVAAEGAVAPLHWPLDAQIESER